MGFFEKPNLYIRNVTLNVMNIEKSLAFYTDFLGFKVLENKGKEVVLTTNGKTALITLIQPAGVTPKERNRTGLYHFAILLPTRADLGKMLVHLAKHRYPIGASDHEVSEALYLNDPDGNGIEIYCDRPADQWHWKMDSVNMTSAQLDAESVMAEAKGEPWEGMPRETVMGHIHLHVSNLAEAANFYQGVLGYDLVLNYGGQALFLSTGKYHHHLGMNTWNGVGIPAPSENSAGMKEYAIDVPDEAYLQKIKAALQNDYVEKDGVVYVTDPSGTTISLHV